MFEMVCMKHIHHIINPIRLQAKKISSWQFISTKILNEGVQIDLFIDRYDDVFTLCRIKYTAQPFVLDKVYAKQLGRKAAVFSKKACMNKQLFEP